MKSVAVRDTVEVNELIVFENVMFQYKNSLVPALSGISINIEASNIVFVLGSNGSGKSTFLKLITKYLHPLEGYVHIKDEALNVSMGGLAKRFLYGNLTVEENILFMSSLYGLSKKKALIRLTDFLETLDVAKIRNKLFKNLSQGQKAIAEIGAAVVSPTRIVVLDEPFEHLDPDRKRRLKKFLEKESRRTFIVTTHDLNNLIDQCKVIFLCNGQVLFKGSVDELLSLYLTKIEFEKIEDKELEHLKETLENYNFVAGTASEDSNLLILTQTGKIEEMLGELRENLSIFKVQRMPLTSVGSLYDL